MQQTWEDAQQAACVRDNTALQISLARFIATCMLSQTARSGKRCAKSWGGACQHTNLLTLKTLHRTSLIQNIHQAIFMSENA